MNGEGAPAETHREELGVLVPHNIIPRGLINAIAAEHSAETKAFRAIMVPNSRGSLLHAFLFHSNCTYWGAHTCPGSLHSEARLGMYFLLRQF